MPFNKKQQWLRLRVGHSHMTCFIVTNLESFRYTEQKSFPVELEKDKLYFMQGLHKDFYGGDNFRAGVTLPNGAALRPIPQMYLRSYVCK